MAKHGSVAGVLTSAANLTATTLFLRNLSELGPTVDHVRTVLQMPQPKVTISYRIYVGSEPFEKESAGSREFRE